MKNGCLPSEWGIYLMCARNRDTTSISAQREYNSSYITKCNCDEPLPEPFSEELERQRCYHLSKCRSNS